VSNEVSVDALAGGFNPSVALEIPRDSLRFEVIRTSQVKDFLDDFRGELPRTALSDGFLSHEPGFTLSGVDLLPPAKAGLRYVKISIRFGVARNFSSILQSHLLTPGRKCLLDNRIPVHCKDLPVVQKKLSQNLPGGLTLLQPAQARVLVSQV